MLQKVRTCGHAPSHRHPRSRKHSHNIIPPPSCDCNGLDRTLGILMYGDCLGTPSFCPLQCAFAPHLSALCSVPMHPTSLPSAVCLCTPSFCPLQCAGQLSLPGPSRARLRFCWLLWCGSKGPRPMSSSCLSSWAMLTEMCFRCGFPFPLLTIINEPADSFALLLPLAATALTPLPPQ